MSAMATQRIHLAAMTKDDLIDWLAVARAALELCEEKLRHYREHGTGEYRGGMEYTALIAKIAAALATMQETS